MLPPETTALPGGRPRDSALSREVVRALDVLGVGNGGLLVAVSGGVDSTVLAHVLAALAPARDLSLALGHVNHGLRVPMVVRMPWGGLRKAGPYHSQNTEAWFYRTPGIKIVTPSTPEDARAFLAAAVADPDPVLFYEHIALYRDPRVKQALPDEAPAPAPLGKAALRRAGDDLLIVSYGAYVHVAMRVAERLAGGGAGDGIEAAVLDLRSLVPLDRETLLRCARHCGKVLVVHEDTRTGGVGESVAAILQEEVFEYLDAPVRVVGALDTPVPYSPPLEKAFLPGEERVEAAARALAAY
jgi:2-oxoisovalerate dehydrogenase E1 component beta subunit